MFSRRDEPFPSEEVRDLLGVVRGMYAAKQAAGGPPRLLARLAAVGRDLAVSLELGENAPGTIGHAKAWERAERAATAVGELVELTDGVQEIVEAAIRRTARPA